MGQGDALAGSCEDDAVLARHRAAAQRREADVALAADAVVPVPRLGGMAGEIDAAALRRRFSQQQGRSGRRVDLHAVVHLDDLDVVVGAQRLGRLADEHREHVHAEAHVAGLDDDRVAARGAELPEVGLAQSRGSDDMDEARLRRDLREGRGGGGVREVQHAVRRREGGQRVGGHGHAYGTQPRREPRILAERRGIPALYGRGQHDAGRPVDGPHERLAHAARRSDDHEPHVHDGIPPSRSGQARPPV